jgi:hypothetical protein
VLEMASNGGAPRRVRVELNIYRRPSGVYEVGFKDGAGVQRWRTVDGGITAARAVRVEMLSRRTRGEQVGTRRRLRFGDGAACWLDGPVSDLRPATRDCYRNALDQHLLPRYAASRLDTITPDDLAALVRERVACDWSCRVDDRHRARGDKSGLPLGRAAIGLVRNEPGLAAPADGAA